MAYTGAVIVVLGGLAGGLAPLEGFPQVGRVALIDKAQEPRALAGAQQRQAALRYGLCSEAAAWGAVSQRTPTHARMSLSVSPTAALGLADDPPSDKASDDVHFAPPFDHLSQRSHVAQRKEALCGPDPAPSFVGWSDLQRGQ